MDDYQWNGKPKSCQSESIKIAQKDSLSGQQSLDLVNFSGHPFIFILFLAFHNWPNFIEKDKCRVTIPNHQNQSFGLTPPI